jgi:hypothetical protein
MGTVPQLIAAKQNFELLNNISAHPKNLKGYALYWMHILDLCAFLS